MAQLDIFNDNLDNNEIFGNDASKLKTLAITLNGITTDFVLCDYIDRQFLIITQFKKIGTFIFVSKSNSKNLNGTGDIYDVKTYCGVDDQDYHLITRYLAEQLGIIKPVLFAICLKDKSLETLKVIVSILKENNFF